MKDAKQLSAEKKNKKKGLRYSVYFHSALVLLALIPFLTSEVNEDSTYEKVVEIDFSTLESSAQKSSTTKSNAAVEKTKKATAPKIEKKPVPVPTPPKPVELPKTETKPTPKPPVPVVTDVVQEKSPVEAVPAPPAPEEVEIPESKPVKVPTKVETPKPAPTPPTPPAADVAEETTGGSAEGTDSEDFAIGEGDSATGGAGESENGTGKGTAAGGDGSGDHGSGILSRRVVHRADVKDITQEEGKIVVNICVNNDGRVVMAKFNSDASSIHTIDLVRKALETAKKYRFEKDYTVPARQCGQLSFVFEIEEE